MRLRLIQQAFLVWVAFNGQSPAVATTNTPAKAEQSYRVRRWTTEDGLPQNRISCLEQTRDGYLWIGTWWGLARFDGVRFVVFDKYNTPELVNDAINALAEDTEGNLWIATTDGLVSYREHRFRRVPLPEVWRLAASRAGGLWVDTGSGLMRFRDGQLSELWPLESAPTGRVLSIHEGPSGWLEIVMQRAWLSLSPQTEQWITNYVGSPTNAYWSAGLPDWESNRLRVCARQGVIDVVRGATNLTFRQPELGWPDASYLFRDRAGGLWINVRSTGLFRWDGENLQEVSLEESFPASSVRCMKEDREGNLWAGTELGLVQLQPRRVRTYTQADGLADDNVWSVCEGNDGTIWVGTDRGLSRIVNNRAEHLTHQEDGHVGYRGVWPTTRSGVWVGANHGALHLVEDTFGPYLKADFRPDSRPTSCSGTLYEDRSGRFWAANGNGAYFFQRGLLTKLTNEIATPNPFDVRAIHEDHQGNFWFGTYGQGLVQWRDGHFKGFTMRDGLSNNRVWGIHEDGEGTLWLATENGLTHFKEQRGVPITSQHGLRENVVNWILEDDFGYFWLSGLRGIYRVSRAELNAVADGRASEVNCAAFTTADGMASSETNGEHAPAGWKARDGRLWFPTTRGVVVIDPKAIHINEVPPKVVVEQVKDDDLVIYGDGAATAKAKSGIQNPSFQLPPGRARVLEIHYTANSFAAPDRVRFKYRLVGYDQDWRRDEANRRAAYYTNLRPGNYRFEVTACNNHGVWNEQPAIFAFSLAPHFWQTWLFYAVCAMAVIGLAAGVQAYRLRWQRRLLKLEELRALASERARIARDLHDDLGTALTGLALELDVIGRASNGESRVADKLSESADRTRSLAERMREVVWTVNPQCDTVSSLANFLEQQISQFLQATDVRVRLDFPEDIPALPLGAEARHQLALAVREALTNVVRHAQATEVVVSLAIADGSLVVQVRDNGRGFTPGAHVGNGLANLRQRLEAVNGRFECVSGRGEGTVLTFRLPLSERPAKTQSA